jgi:hypothetical protein
VNRSDDAILAVLSERAMGALESALARVAVAIVAGISAVPRISARPGVSASALGVADRHKRPVNAVANRDVELEDVAATTTLATHTAITAASSFARSSCRVLISPVSPILATSTLAAAPPWTAGLAKAASALYYESASDRLRYGNNSAECGVASGVANLPGLPHCTIEPVCARACVVVVIPPQRAIVISVRGAPGGNVGRRTWNECGRIWWNRIGVSSHMLIDAHGNSPRHLLVHEQTTNGRPRNPEILLK